MRCFSAIVLVLLLRRTVAISAPPQTLIPIYHSVGDIPVNSAERVTYQCTFRNLWTKQRQPVNYPEENAQWTGPIMWTHREDFLAWQEGVSATQGLKEAAEDGQFITLVQEMQQGGEKIMTYTENPQLLMSMGTAAEVERRQYVHMYPIQTTEDYPYLSTFAKMQPSPDWFTGFFNVSLSFRGFWYNHFKVQSYVWDAGTDDGVTYEREEEETASESGEGNSPRPQPRPQPRPPLAGGIPGIPGINLRSPHVGTVERLEFPDSAPPGGELLGATIPFIPPVAEWECLLHVGSRDIVMPSCDWFANPCCNETDPVNCGAKLPYNITSTISREYQEVIESEMAIHANAGRVELSTTAAVNFAEEGTCGDCNRPGHFCGVDGQCHEFSCNNFYKFADPLLTGYDGDTVLECNGYVDGVQNLAHGVVYGCDSVFPFTRPTPGEQVTKAFDLKCSIARSNGYRFDCWQFQPTTDNARFQQEGQSSFITSCPGGTSAKYYYNIASSHHYVGYQGLQGDPVLEGGADADGDTVWQSNKGSAFDPTIAAYAMYADVVLPTDNVFDNQEESEPAGNSIMDIIRNNPELSKFGEALSKTELGALLHQSAGPFTVFAPSNTAVDSDAAFSLYMSSSGWSHHLRANLQLMIVPDQALRDGQIFDGERVELISLNGTLQISQPFATVNLVTLSTRNLQGSNGVVHILDGVVKNYWRYYTLRDVEQHEELTDGLSPILTRLGFDDPLNQNPQPSGTSWIASRNRGYGNDSIALGYYPIVAELKDPQNTAFQNEAYMYNLIDLNLYEQEIPPGFQLFVLPRNSNAHMLITKDGSDGTLRFNDAELDRQAFADNGITQIVTKPLVPPGLAMLMRFCADYTNINLRDMAQLYRSSEWNPRDLRESIGSGREKFSLFIPIADGLADIDASIQHLSTLEWKRHLWDLLLHMATEPARTVAEWYDVVEDAGGSMSVEMLSGSDTVFEIQNGVLTIDGARILQHPSDVKGIDGYMHIVERVLRPPSVCYSTYELLQEQEDTTTLTRLIDIVQLGDFIDFLMPVTVFAALDDAWDRVIPTLEIEDLLKNMIFELLWFDDTLANMDGETLTSTNGKKWTVQVFDDAGGQPFHYKPEMSPATIYISNTYGPEGLTNCSLLPAPSKRNILTSSGIIHYVDCLFLDFNYTISDQNAPTWAPITPVLPPASSLNDCGDCLSGFFCSSDTNRCEELTCSNWRRGAPDGDVAYSTKPCGGGAEFCGTDGSCHEFSCENWFIFGPMELTGKNPNVPVQFQCFAYTKGEEENMNSVTYGCRSWPPGVQTPEVISWTHYFNKKCVASLEGNVEFRCYQNQLDTDYRDFLGQVARLNPPGCDREIDENEQPQYWYNIEAHQYLDGQNVQFNNGRTKLNTISSASFDADIARRTMFATITLKDTMALETSMPTPAIPLSPTSPENTTTAMNSSKPALTEPVGVAILVVVVNASFDAYNIDGLTAEDLMSPENKVVLQEAFLAFVNALVDVVNADQQGRTLMRLLSQSEPWHRSLAVSLQAGSPAIYNVIDIECQGRKGTIPDGASCQSILGRYDLTVSADIDIQSVQDSYSEATDDAIEEGKMQSSLELAAKNTSLASMVVTGTTPQDEKVVAGITPQDENDTAGDDTSGAHKRDFAEWKRCAMAWFLPVVALRLL